MIEQLFGSKTRVKLLKLFYGSPNRQFYVREITRRIEEQINSVRRELSNLLNIGIIVSDSNNNKLYYEVNQKFKFYGPLFEIFGKNKEDVKLSDKNKDNENLSKDYSDLSAIGRVELALLTGQFTRDESTGIDLLIIGEINPNAAAKYVSSLEAQENKSLRYSIMNMDNFRYRLDIRDRFASTVLNSKKQILVDIYNVLGDPNNKSEE
ncbi:MAG: transcriptional regulator [Patescibacteria group bacterium]|jgi:hypothetical protein|nr:transcriptional regulator [Patescibacteria group bacterium]